MDQLTSKPFPNALNIVLSRDNLPDVINIDNTIVCESLDSVVRRLQQEPNLDQVFTILKLQKHVLSTVILKNVKPMVPNISIDLSDYYLLIHSKE